MLKSCQYCGKVHDKKIDCGKRPVKKKGITYIDRFRWSGKWKHKSCEIMQRDTYLCQVCKRNLYDTATQYMTDGLSVHHIVPLAEDFDRRLDNDNLITLCPCHHAMAERYMIPVRTLTEIVQQQEAGNT